MLNINSLTLYLKSSNTQMAQIFIILITFNLFNVFFANQLVLVKKDHIISLEYSSYIHINPKMV